MKKISTLFKKDPANLWRVIDEIDPENAWVYECGIPTQKFDGTACAVINGELYRRYDAKHGKTPPAGAIPCQDPDPVSGHWPHWVKCTPVDTLYKGVYRGEPDGTYELCGPKVQGNPERFPERVLVPHGAVILPVEDFSFEGLKKYLSDPAHDIEGIVFHASDGSGRMCKIRKKDFGIERGKE